MVRFVLAGVSSNAIINHEKSISKHFSLELGVFKSLHHTLAHQGVSGVIAKHDY
jgi:hypothetical protein